MSDSFYIGYHDRTDGKTAKRIAIIAAVLVMLFLSFGFYWTGTLSDAGSGVYEFGQVRTFHGTVAFSPHPTLIMRGEDAQLAELLLVAPFKFGADPIVRPFDGLSVKLRGTRILRNGITMIELSTDSISTTDAAVIQFPGPEPESSQITVTGQIVDSKCWLGVMNPGEGVVHRACASLCIRGGIPPVFVFDRGNSSQEFALIYKSNGEPFADAILPFVARRITLTGLFSPAQSGRIARFQLDSLQ